MAIHTEAIEEIDSGFAKGIEESALGLIMQNLQKYQYQFPIKSMVREVVCNGIDSIADKNSALDILLNKADVSKYYVENDAALYRDSKWDPNYYDPAWLSKDDKVYITYHEGRNQEKDRIVIKDNGVGLGGKRLKGYFQLGFSTKRLSKLPLGKFGIGAKSALAVGVQFYTVESKYNGKLFRFNVYSSKVDSIIPRFNLTSGKENASINFGTEEQPHLVYYEDTTEKNSLTVTVECKKHHKQHYLDAVKSQLLYFPNIVLTVSGEPGMVDYVVDHKANILYEDEYIILSDNKMWSKPHLLVNKVNYGYVNWEELELEPHQGNIGIKVLPEEVEINPSRESIIWSEETKAMVLQRFNDVVRIATNFVQKTLQETDLIKWLRVCYSISQSGWSQGNENNVVSTLAKIVDLNNIEPYFPNDTRIKFNTSSPFPCFLVRHYHYNETFKANARVKKVKREDIGNKFSLHHHLPIVLVDEDTSVRKDKYLLTKVYLDGFIGIRKPDWLNLPELSDPEFVATAEFLHRLNLIPDNTSEADYKRKKLALPSSASAWKYLEQSEHTILYSSIDVPESFNGTDEEEDEVLETTEEEVEQNEVRKGAEAERRKLENKILVNYPYYKGYGEFGFAPQETAISTLNTWDSEEIFYGNSADSEALALAHFFTSDQERSTIKIVRVAQNLNKYFRDFKHINQFYEQVKNGTLTMSNALIKWNTARLILKELPKLSFLWNYRAFDNEKSKNFGRLVEFVKNYYQEVSNYTRGDGKVLNSAAYNQLLTRLDNILMFQTFVASTPSDEDIAKAAREMFGSTIITDGCAVMPEEWAILQDLLEYASSLSMLNEMPILTGLSEGIPDDQEALARIDRECPSISDNLEYQVKEYLQFKGVL